MTLGADTWDAAPEIWGGPFTSDPTPLPPVEGPDRPYHSAWWKITPDRDCYATIDTSQSLATNPDWSTDTYLIVYRGDTFETSTFVSANDDGGGNASSRLTTPLSSGVTYHIRAGSFGSDGSDIATLVLNVSLAVMSDWIQAPDVTRTLTAAVGPQTLSRVDDQSATVSSPSAGVYSDVVNNAWASIGNTLTYNPGTADLSAGTGPGIDTRGGVFSGQWTYVAGSQVGATVRAQDLRLGTAETFFSPFAMAPYLPDDAGDDAADSIELETSDWSGTRLATHLVYQLFEESNDRSANPSVFLDAVGTWTHHMDTPVGSVDVPGPGPYNTQIAAGSLDVSGHLDPVDGAVPISLRTIWGSVTPRDPTFGNSVGLIRVGAGHWFLHTESLIRPPRFRYLKPFTGEAPPEPSPPVDRLPFMPPARLLGRMDGAFFGARRLDTPGPSRQSGFRPGAPGSYY